MELKDVPNDSDHFKGKDKVKKVIYAIDEKGHYETTKSSGWEVENMATKQAWDEAEAEIELLRKKVMAGELSPIPYFMKKHLMDIGILAKYMGKFKWQIKRHYKPERFKNLGNQTLQKYCTVFNITIQELKQPNL